MAIGLALLAPAAQASWSRPFEFSPPGSLDTLPSQVAFSTHGALAVGYSVLDVDAPAASQAFVTVRTRGGSLTAPRPVPGAQQLLGLAYDGSSLELHRACSAGRGHSSAASPARHSVRS
jgi:hypothetical protein